MKPSFPFLLLNLLLLASCSPAAPGALPKPFTVQYSAAAQSWLAGLYDCAGETPVIADQRAAQYFDSSADLAIRLGEPEHSTTPAFEIGIEEIIVIVHPQNPVEELGVVDVRGLFSGRIRNWSQAGGADTPVQVWSYSPGEDIQQIFAASVMRGAAVASLARLAASPDEMAQVIANDAGAVGILPRRWLTEDVQEVYVAATVPVLAIASAELQGAVKDLLACLQE